LGYYNNIDIEKMDLNPRRVFGIERSERTPKCFIVAPAWRKLALSNRVNLYLTILKEPTVKLGIYQHYRGNYYQVLGVSRHSETLEELVVYQALYGDFGLWVRPISMFIEKVNHNSVQVPRFKPISEGVANAPGVR